MCPLAGQVPHSREGWRDGPEPSGLVSRRGEDAPAVGAEYGAVENFLVSGEREQLFARFLSFFRCASCMSATPWPPKLLAQSSGTRARVRSPSASR
jgi:hypothetical protein